MKLQLEIIKLQNEDVITTSTCEYLSTPSPGRRASGHYYAANTIEYSTPYYYKEGILVCYSNGPSGPKFEEAGWYHFDYDLQKYVKCDVGNEGHPHRTVTPD